MHFRSSSRPVSFPYSGQIPGGFLVQLANRGIYIAIPHRISLKSYADICRMVQLYEVFLHTAPPAAMLPNDGSIAT